MTTLIAKNVLLGEGRVKLLRLFFTEVAFP